MPPSPPNSEIDVSFETDDLYFFKNEFYEDELISEDKLPPVTIFPVANRFNSLNVRLSQPPKPVRHPLSQNSLNRVNLNSSQHRKHANNGKYPSKRSSRENGISIASTGLIGQKSGDPGRSANGDRRLSENFNPSKESIPALSSSVEINSDQSNVLAYQNYDTKANFQTTSSAYDSAMLSALNNGLSSNNRSEKKSIDGIIFKTIFII